MIHGVAFVWNREKLLLSNSDECLTYPGGERDDRSWHCWRGRRIWYENGCQAPAPPLYAQYLLLSNFQVAKERSGCHYDFRRNPEKGSSRSHPPFLQASKSRGSIFGDLTDRTRGRSCVTSLAVSYPPKIYAEIIIEAYFCSSLIYAGLQQGRAGNIGMSLANSFKVPW